jgi:hypothetical protein
LVLLLLLFFFFFTVIVVAVALTVAVAVVELVVAVAVAVVVAYESYMQDTMHAVQYTIQVTQYDKDRRFLCSAGGRAYEPELASESSRRPRGSRPSLCDAT